MAITDCWTVQFVNDGGKLRCISTRASEHMASVSISCGTSQPVRTVQIQLQTLGKFDSVKRGCLTDGMCRLV